MPNVESNLLDGEAADLPSAIFPSDHLRISAEFEVFHNQVKSREQDEKLDKSELWYIMMFYSFNFFI